MEIHEGVQGRWVFVPLPKRMPDSYCCLRRSQIVLRLWFRNLPPELYDYCVSNAVLPPARLTFTRLVKFIEEHRRAAKAECGPAMMPVTACPVKRANSPAQRAGQGREFTGTLSVLS